MQHTHHQFYETQRLHKVQYGLNSLRSSQKRPRPHVIVDRVVSTRKMDDVNSTHNDTTDGVTYASDLATEHHQTRVDLHGHDLLLGLVSDRAQANAAVDSSRKATIFVTALSEIVTTAVFNISSTSAMRPPIPCQIRIKTSAKTPTTS